MSENKQTAIDTHTSAHDTATGMAYKKCGACRILADSTADFAPGIIESLGIEVIPFPYVIDGKEHLDDNWQTTTPHEFYERMRKGEIVTTSAVTLGRYVEVFERYAELGDPTIYIGFTGGLSSSIETARQAADMVKANHPDFEIYVIDSLCPSAAASLLIMEAVHQAQSGLSVSELVSWIEEARFFIQGFFTLDGFDALARGGRIPPTAAHIGTKLDMKPKLSYDLHGALTLDGLCRGRKKALKSIIQSFEDTFDGDTLQPILIVSADAKDADWLEKNLHKIEGCQEIPIMKTALSPVIGAHTGPDMLAICFWGKDRREANTTSSRIAKKITSHKKEA